MSTYTRPTLNNWYILQDKLCGDINGINLYPIYVNGIRVIRFINKDNIEIAFANSVEKNGKIISKNNSTVVLLGEMDSYPKLKERSILWLQTQHINILKI